jgi:hypothetical protein
MPERIETTGPDGAPCVVELTDAALSQLGRVAAIAAALASCAPTGSQRAPRPSPPNSAKER